MLIALDIDLDLPAARRLKETLVEALAGEGPVALDAAGVERLSTPAIQVILAAGEHSVACGRPLSIRNATAAFKAAFEDLGLSPLLAAMETAA